MAILERLLPSPGDTYVAIALAVGAAAAFVRCLRRCARSFRNPGHARQSEWLIRGVRAGILAVALACFSMGLLRDSAPWLLFGLVFLFEEILETGVMLLAIRRGQSSRPSTTES